MKNLVLLGFFLIGVLLMSGCQSPETKQFSKNLLQTNENLEVNLKNINSDFNEYDSNYGANKNVVAITDSMVTGMYKEESNIKEAMSNTEKVVSDYQVAKQSANLNSLSEEDKNVVSQIDAKINDYNSNKNVLSSCLSSMQNYRGLANLDRDTLELLEELKNQVILVKGYEEMGNYYGVLKEIDALQGNIAKMKENVQAMQARGIQVLTNEQIESLDMLSQALDGYKGYISSLMHEDYETAKLKYAESYQKSSVAISMATKNAYSATEIANKMDSWYQNNIGVCFDLFNNY